MPPTIPARLARTTRSSRNWAEAKARARTLYRQWYRAAPEIVTLYAINLHPSAIRAKLRQEFERHQGVDDLQTMDVLLLKSHQEYQESLNA